MGWIEDTAARLLPTSATPDTPQPGCAHAPTPAHDVARRILASAWWAVFTFNGITAYGDGHDSLIGGDALSDGERDALLELCRQRLDAFREQRGEEVFAHRSRQRSPISGSVKYQVLTCAHGPLRVLRSP